jgi:hypothetical protein
MRNHLSSLLFIALVASCSSSDSLGTKGQLITCETDPGTDVILSCHPGESDDGDSHSCNDIDEDGDGQPNDNNPTIRSGGDDDTSGDSDDDGVDDNDDCDEHPGGDDDDDHGDVDLPYDIKMKRGDTYTPVVDAFAEKGAQPAQIISITGATWRASELAAGTPFAITQADCDHAGNRDQGRDRVIVRWKNADGSSQSDHLDLRYCD